MVKADRQTDIQDNRMQHLCGILNTNTDFKKIRKYLNTNTDLKNMLKRLKVF